MNTDRTRRPQSVDDILQWLKNPSDDPDDTIPVPEEGKRPPQPPKPPVPKNDEFSLLGCFYIIIYMIIMIVIGYIVGTII